MPCRCCEDAAGPRIPMISAWRRDRADRYGKRSGRPLTALWMSQSMIAVFGRDATLALRCTSAAVIA